MTPEQRYAIAARLADLDDRHPPIRDDDADYDDGRADSWWDDEEEPRR